MEKGSPEFNVRGDFPEPSQIQRKIYSNLKTHGRGSGLQRDLFMPDTPDSILSTKKKITK